MKEFSRELSVVLGPTSYRLTSGHRVFLTKWRDELKSFERALYSFRFQRFFLNWQVKDAQALVANALNNLMIEERNNPVLLDL